MKDLETVPAQDTADDYFLRSVRLGFRHWREQDLPLAVGLWGDPAVTRFIDIRPKLSEEQVREVLETQIRMEQKHGIQYWPIFLVATAEHVGACGLRVYDLSTRVYEIGVHIRSRFWQRGLAEEATRVVIQYAFCTLRATGLFAGHNPNNLASQRLLLKLGFRYTHHEYYSATGLKHPSYALPCRVG